MGVERANRSTGGADWLPARVRSAGTESALKSGQTLFRAGQRALGLYEIVSGRVRLIRVDKSGGEIILHSADAGNTFAEASLFAPTYHCDAVATTAAVVRLYPKAVILAEFGSSRDAAFAFMACLARQVMDLRTRLERRNIRSARERVRQFLAVNASANGHTFVLPGTIKELAADLGLTHEALYRTLARMAADGEIKRASGKISFTGGM